VVLALSANRHYALRGVRPGARFAKVSRRLHAGRRFHVGHSTWYLTRADAGRGVLEVQHGAIVAVGIADKSLIAKRGVARRLLSGLS
jgi:hypothetical protein